MAKRGATATDLLVYEDGASRALPRVSVFPCFQDVYRAHFDFAGSSAARFSVDASATDDLVQEVFIVVHAKLHTVENPKVAVEDELRPSDPTPLEHAQREADLHLLGTLLGQLDSTKRESFALVELEQLMVPEVAEMLRIPLNTAYSRLRLARQVLEPTSARHGKREEGFRA